MGLDTVQLLLRVEAAFGISISDAKAASARTVGALNRLIAEKVATNASKPGQTVKPEFDITWECLVPIVIEELGVRREKVTPDAEWARDLGAS